MPIRRLVVGIAAAAALVGALSAGAGRIDGTNGRDVLRGTPRNDALYGRGGDDRLLALAGDDLVNGGSGRDVLEGGSGRDRMLARDGARDIVRCGGGADTAIVDRIDVVSGCESVRRPPPRAPRLESASFAGTGNAQRQVELAPGYDLIASASHSGSSNFVVWLAGPGSESILLFDQQGPYAGRRATSTRGGSYRLSVTASGPWRLELTQPPASGDRSLLGTIAGSGDEVFRVTVSAPGTYVVAANFTGGSQCSSVTSGANCSFVVELRRNPERQLLFASTGPAFSGWSATVRPLQAGVYLLSVRGTTLTGAPGTWSLTFTR